MRPTPPTLTSLLRTRSASSQRQPGMCPCVTRGSGSEWHEAANSPYKPRTPNYCPCSKPGHKCLRPLPAPTWPERGRFPWPSADPERSHMLPGHVSLTAPGRAIWVTHGAVRVRKLAASQGKPYVVVPAGEEVSSVLLSS